MARQTQMKVLCKRRKRKEKLRKLREKYKSARTNEEKEKILEKAKKIAPWLLKDEFLAPLNEHKK